jgi:undecaprenyl diphosphate synthase
MVVAMSYSSKQELVRATRQIAEQVKSGAISIDDIDEQTINDHLWTNLMPDPELLIRTGGELRISNYLLWQCAYSEFYFCDTYWPDFDEEALHEAIANYQSRQRRFGKTEAQVESEA